jgi:hypothetical protein
MPKRSVRRLTLLALPATLLLAAPAAAAPVLEFGEGAARVAGGAGGVVLAVVTCDAAPDDAHGQTQNLFIQLRQAVGDGIASGSGFTEGIGCDGQPHGIEVAFLADPGGRPFRVGDAVVQGSLTVCNGTPEPMPHEGPVGVVPAHEAPPAPVPPGPEPGPVPGPDPAPVPDPGPVPPQAPCLTTTTTTLIVLQAVSLGEGG